MNGNGNMPELPATVEELKERIEQRLRMLARYRLQNDEARQGLIGLIKQLEATLEYEHWSEAKAIAERDVTITERLIREDVLAYCELTGEKPAVKGLGTRTKTTLLYQDTMALAWCQLFFEQALALNRDLFEKHARAVAETNPIPFVTMVKETIPTIAQDLSEWLEEVQEDGFPA